MNTTLLPPRRYSVIVTWDAESETWLANVPTLGIMTFGTTADEAFEMAEDAISGHLEALIARHLPIPVEDHPAEVRSLTVR
ncbi:MAG TPA: type II toxin-antitoxin system HicB family antitoxin [Thermomicrobiales bacterium]|jgi:predicted RNase H-like HicB family nuclease|nr:HicB family protein [Chloroflexota bacterium]HQX63849.1 type II toxin-antitoxin system HicB family antitoxin [Thermomicrobiales bacterium]HBY45455.1 HicB family protein [Chloroflexota bacterium]HCG30213.1 HicB family protein [Chloroflexota bacterium]HQZ90941.1 type II toxin-antitoxin system HicB family antitoxin [Thermomicrobiales bacterium]